MNELGKLLQRSEQVLIQSYNCDGINIGINLGRAVRLDRRTSCTSIWFPGGTVIATL